MGGDKGNPGAPLLDVNGNPIEAVYTDDGQMVPPRMVDENGNVVHEGPPPKEGMSTASKVAIGGAVVGGAALATLAAATATGVGVSLLQKEKEGRRFQKG